MEEGILVSFYIMFIFRNLFSDLYQKSKTSKKNYNLK